MEGSGSEQGRMPRRSPRRSRAAVRVAGIVIATLVAAVLTGSYSPVARRLLEGLIDNATEAPFYVLPDPLPAGRPLS